MERMAAQRIVTLGFALGKFSLTLGKLTFEIGYPLIGIGERAVGRRAHFSGLVGNRSSRQIIPRST